MIYLMVRHKTRQGKQGEIQEACKEVVRLWQKYGGEYVGIWTNWIGGESDEIILMMRFKDFDDYQEKDVKVHSDPDWVPYISRIGEVSTGRTTELLRPTEYSKLQ